MSVTSNTTLSTKASAIPKSVRAVFLAFASFCFSAFSFGGNTIVITSPTDASNADHNTDLSVNVSYQTNGGGYQTPTWAYKIDSSFPTSYQSSHGGIQVTNHTTVNDFLVGQPNGMRNVHVALLDQAGNLLNPIVTASVQVNYQSGGGNYQSGHGGNQSQGGGSKVLYNTSTHQVLTQAQVQAGGTGWVLLDPNNANYSSYQHPAYYNTSTHGVLDSSPNDMEAGWILTFQQSGNNNNYQSQAGGDQIQILAPSNGTVVDDHHDNILVGVNYASSGGAYQTPKWAYKIDSPFPGNYQSSHGGTVVDGHYKNDFMHGQSYGQRTLYVTMLEQNGSLKNPPLGMQVSFNYQSSGGNYQSGGGGNQSQGGGDQIFIVSPGNGTAVDQNNDGLLVNVNYASPGGSYQTPKWAYKIDAPFPSSYQTSHGGTVVDGHYKANFMNDGQNFGQRTVYVTLLEQNGNLRNPPLGAHLSFNYQSQPVDYQSGGGGNQSGGGGTKVLYNTSTHQVLTQAQVQAGGTGWVLLDPNNANYSSYQHPAYYNTSTHGVLDNSPNDMEAGWILTFQQSGNNNYQSQGGGYSGPYQNTGNLKTDSRNALFDDYIEFKGLYSVSKLKHDYNTSTYFNQSIDALSSQLQALPMPPSTSRGDAVDQWIAANFDSSNKFDHHKTLPTFDMTVVGNLDLNDSGALKTLAGNHDSIYFQFYLDHQDDNSTAKILYNPTTYQSVTPFKVQAGGTDWMVLNPNSYPNYSHPAYYNISIHKALDQSPGDTAGDWILTEQVLYDSATHQVVTQQQIAAGGTGWMVLPSGQPGYSHPAYYNTSTHQVLDQNTTSAGGWMITGTSSGGQSGGTQKVIWALSIEGGDGNRSNIMVDMAGKVYNGDFNSYWHTVHGIETWNSSHWHETHYSANSAGIESLLLAHPVIFDPTSEVHTIKPFDFVADAQVALGSQSSIVQLAANHGKIYFQKYNFPEANSPQASAHAKVLYNTGTHQVLTPEQIQSGTTGWMLLDPSKYPNYSHPAYYNLAVHKALDSSPGSSVADNSGNWILTEQSGNSHGGNQQTQSDTLNPLDIVSGKDRDQGYQADGGISKVLYNTATHQVLSKSQVQAGGTGWVLLESNNSNYATYDHPAYYNTSSHQVLQNKAGSKVGDWILTNPQSGGQNTTHVSTDSNGSQVGAFMPYTGPYTAPSLDLRIDARNALFDDHIENKGLNSVAKLKADYNSTKAFNDSIDALAATLPGLAAPPSTARGDAIDNWIKGEFEQVKTLDPKKEVAFVWVLSLEEPTNNGVNKVIDMHGNVYDTDYESYWLSVYGVATHKDPNWSEVEYDATSTGIAKLIQDHPFVDPSVAVESKYKMAVVETDDPQVQGSTLQLSGSLRDSNGTTIMQVGFLISSQGHPSITDPNSQTISASNVNNLLTASYVVPSGGVYYVRTFAQTMAGYSEGPVRKVEVFLNDLSSSDPKVVALAMIREDTIELAGGWRQSSWFGLYLDHGNGWIYHQVHGWLYMFHDGQNGIWTWQQQRKWVWTSKELYPYLYQADTASWLYLLGIVNGKAVFFNYGTNQIEIR